jgi:hypothetical protein
VENQRKKILPPVEKKPLVEPVEDRGNNPQEKSGEKEREKALQTELFQVFPTIHRPYYEYERNKLN